MTHRSFRSFATIVFMCLFWAGPSYASNEKSATEQVNALFIAYWENMMADFPEKATRVGDNRYSDRWHDVSPKAVAKRRADRRDFENKLNHIDAAALKDEDRLSLSILCYVVHQKVALDAIYGDLPFSSDDAPFAITQMSGIQLDLPALLRATPLKTATDYESLIKRLDALPAYLDNVTGMLRTGIKSGWMPAKISIQKVPSQFDALLVPALDSNPIFRPFASFPSDITEADQQRLRAQAQETVQQRVLPALSKLQAFMASEYLPAASANIAASALPGKMAYYQSMLTASNTTSMTPDQIHQLGLREVDRLDQALQAVKQDSGFNGTRTEFDKFLNSDPQFFFPTAEAMLASYRDIAKRIDARLPEQFATLPRQPYGIRAMLPAEGDGPEHYTAGALDGSRAGYFEANVNNLKRRANWSMEDLVLHEAVPGHHLQIARAAELTGVPMFRRDYRNSGYSEGWALYAESLGPELGMYTTPYTRYGFLSSEMIRACRLVVDTGIHAFGMTRDQAIRYLVEHAAVTAAFATAEVDRYIVWPGQATAYKLGQLEIRALHDKAHSALSAKFDVRKFNNEILDHGGLPLDILNAEVERWIGRQH